MASFSCSSMDSGGEAIRAMAGARAQDVHVQAKFVIACKCRTCISTCGPMTLVLIRSRKFDEFVAAFISLVGAAWVRCAWTSFLQRGGGWPDMAVRCVLASSLPLPLAPRSEALSLSRQRFLSDPLADAVCSRQMRAAAHCFGRCAGEHSERVEQNTTAKRWIKGLARAWVSLEHPSKHLHCG